MAEYFTSIWRSLKKFDDDHQIVLRPKNETPYLNMGKRELAEHFGDIEKLSDLRAGFCTPQDIANLTEAGFLKKDEPIFYVVRTRGRFPDESKVEIKVKVK